MVGIHQIQQNQLPRTFQKLTFLPKKDWADGKQRQDSKKQIQQQIKNVAKWNWYGQQILLGN